MGWGWGSGVRAKKHSPACSTGLRIMYVSQVICCPRPLDVCGSEQGVLPELSCILRTGSAALRH